MEIDFYAAELEFFYPISVDLMHPILNRISPLITSSKGAKISTPFEN